MLRARLAFVLLFLAAVVNSSHFRGGTISWEHLASNGSVHRTRFSYRFGYRRNAFGNICDSSTINNREPGYSAGRWALSGGVGSLASTEIICTAYDSTENWAYGYNSFETNITIWGAVSLRFSGNAWLRGTIYVTGGWSMKAANIDFSVRSDTGRVNRPPQTFSLPVVRLQLGCPSSIDIKWTDADNDRVTCRYASTYEECGSVCGQYSHFALDGNACSINYDGGGGAFLVPVAIVLEDHPRQGISLDGTKFISQNDTLSQIPLQFIVHIEQSTAACNAVPTYPSFAIQDNATYTISSTGTFNETLFAYPSASTLTIIQFIILGPVGVVNSGIYTVGIGLYAVNILWEPDPTQSGEHIVCYHAVDSRGNTGRQRCFSVVVAAILTPCDADDGGCSDICIPRGSNRDCACSLSCWSLIQDGKTCVPDMAVTCTGDQVDLYVDSCASNRTVVVGNSQNHFSNETCQSVTANNQHHLNFKSHECGVTFQVNPVLVQYFIRLWIWEEENTGSSVITRGFWRMVPITCSLPANSSVDASFVPVLPLVDEFFPQTVVIDEIGTLELYFEFYRDITFTAAYGPTEYPLEIRVNDDIHFALGAVGRPGLVIFTEECVASATNPSDGTVLTYTLIDDGCFLEPTLEEYTSTNQMQDRFRMRAFEFRENLVAQRQNADISIQCQVILCDATDNTTRCFQGCQPGFRRRRSLDSSGFNSASRSKRNIEEEEELPPALSQSPPQGISTRFIFIVDDDDDSNENDATTNHANWILICVATLVLAIGA